MQNPASIEGWNSAEAAETDVRLKEEGKGDYAIDIYELMPVAM